uniref:Uncharacterized protein n=1 Tax=Rhizophora mucronata TaxID=61149 RepID=A0A2P2QXQ2_RHIMU
MFDSLSLLCSFSFVASQFALCVQYWGF